MNVVEQIYQLRKNFILIGLTGRTGSGCTTVANVLATPECKSLKSLYLENNDKPINNEIRKNKIIYQYIQNNWQGFQVLKASDIIFYYALLSDFETFMKSFSEGKKLEDETKGGVSPYWTGFKQKYDALSLIVKECDAYLKEKRYDDDEKNKKCKQVILKDIPEFRNSLKELLNSSIKKKVLYKELQQWGNNIRIYDSIVADKEEKQSEHSPSCLARKINQFVKLFRVIDRKDKTPTLIAIDALRNPFEVLYFRERYSAFYLMSVNTTEKVREDNLFKLGYRIDEIEELDKKEKAKGDFSNSYQEIDLDKCIELSDIHITHDGTKVGDNRHLINQIFTYLALIQHPGLVPPSPMERVMQVAYTAKLNSGCLSRQVGAAVTDESFSVKAIGWNTVAEGQTPCSLRRLDDLCEKEDANAYSAYEKGDETFFNYASTLHTRYITDSSIEKLKGLPLSYCFKDIYTTVTGQLKNQVHTRSLHAEENSFLQLAKYGTIGIKGGKLFTTASPCELCAKKAYQLGIKEIYYIDTYPGISMQHILDCGDKKPDLILFQGAIGRAYVSLYNPMLPLKDEIKAITGINAKQAEIENKKKEQIND